jgi:hypothetical protein
MVYYHNTLTARVLAAQASNYHFRNNLILGWWPSETLFSVDTFTNYTSSDYNGFSPDPQAADSFVWKSPPFRELKNYTDQRIKRKFGSLKEYSQATGQDQNSVLVDYDIFVNVGKPDTEDFARIYDAKELDFRLKPDAVAVDAGCVLPNINEEYTGKAPDLGALEVGEPDPVYGPRT